MIVELSRFVAFGGSRIRLDHRGPRAGQVVEFLYRDACDHEEAPLQARFRIEDDPEDESVIIWRDDAVCHRGESLADAAQVLQEAVSYALAAGSSGGLLFHAAAASRRARACLLPGKSGSGKTTVTSRLVAEGFRYLTDELSFVADGGLSVRALPRPLNVKVSGRTAVPHDLEAGGQWASLVSQKVMLLQPPASQAASSCDAVALALVVFPRFQQGEAVRLTRLNRAECGMRLMACLLNARNLPDHGFTAVSTVARSVQSYELVYGEADQVGARLQEFM